MQGVVRFDPFDPTNHHEGYCPLPGNCIIVVKNYQIMHPEAGRNMSGLMGSGYFFRTDAGYGGVAAMKNYD